MILILDGTRTSWKRQILKGCSCNWLLMGLYHERYSRRKGLQKTPKDSKRKGNVPQRSQFVIRKTKREDILKRELEKKTIGMPISHISILWSITKHPQQLHCRVTSSSRFSFRDFPINLYSVLIHWGAGRNKRLLLPSIFFFITAIPLAQTTFPIKKGPEGSAGYRKSFSAFFPGLNQLSCFIIRCRG